MTPGIDDNCGIGEGDWSILNIFWSSNHVSYQSLRVSKSIGTVSNFWLFKSFWLIHVNLPCFCLLNPHVSKSWLLCRHQLPSNMKRRRSRGERLIDSYRFHRKVGDFVRENCRTWGKKDGHVTDFSNKLEVSKNCTPHIIQIGANLYTQPPKIDI